MSSELDKIYNLLNTKLILRPDFWMVVSNVGIAVALAIIIPAFIKRKFKAPENKKWNDLWQFFLRIVPSVTFVLYILWSFGTFAVPSSKLWQLVVDMSVIFLLWRVSNSIFDVWLKNTKYRWISARTLVIVKLTLVLLVLLRVLHYFHLSTVESRITVISLKLLILGVITMTFMRKERVISLFPGKIELTNYHRAIALLNKIYYPLITISLVVLFVRILGYYASFQKIFFQLWILIGIYVVYSYVHYIIFRWYEKNPDEYKKATYSLLMYLVFVLFVISSLKIIGVYTFLVSYTSEVVLFTVRSTSVTLYHVLKSIFLFIGIYRFGWFLREFISTKLSALLKWPDTIRVPVSVFSMYFVVFLGIVISLKIVGVDLTALSIFAGALGVGVGIGLQDIARGMISGITILLTRIVKIGDFIMIKEDIGRVEKMDIRSVTIKTLDNVELIVPSQQFINSPVVNFTYSNPIIRLHIPFGVAYGSDPDKVKEVVLEAVKSYTYIEPTPPPEVLFLEFGDNALNFEVVVWYNSRYREMKFVRSDINYIICRALAENGIEIPFPQRDVHIKSGVPWNDIIDALKHFNTLSDRKGDGKIGPMDKRD